MSLNKVEGRQLVKRFGRTRALAGVNVELRAGEVTIIEGTNGSGKSTLLSLLSLIAKPSSGHLRFDNRKVRASDRSRISVLSHEPMLYADLDASQNIDFFAKLVAAKKERRDSLYERFRIQELDGRPVRSLSRGQKQRVALSRALLSMPALLLLDEPSTGLDEASVELLRDVILEEKERGAVVAVVTHSDSFASEIADQRVRLHRGKRVEA